jgi:hypothetical protein
VNQWNPIGVPEPTTSDHLIGVVAARDQTIAQLRRSLDDCKECREALAAAMKALEPFDKWWHEAENNIAPRAIDNECRTPIAYSGRYGGPTLGQCRDAAAVRDQIAKLLEPQPCDTRPSSEPGSKP